MDDLRPENYLRHLRRRSIFADVAIAILTIALSAGLTVVVGPISRLMPFAIVYVTIIAVAVYGSSRAGVIAALIGMVFADLVLFSIRAPSPWAQERIVPSLIYGFVSVLAVALVDRLRHSQVSLREREMRLATVINAATDAIIAVDGSERIVLFSAAAKRMFGRRARDVIGQSIDILIPARFQAPYRASLFRFGQDDPAQRPPGATGQAIAVRASGEEFPIEVSISVARSDASTLYTIGIRDVSQRLAQEREIERLNRLYTVLAKVNRAMLARPTRTELLETVCRILVDDGQLRMAWIGWNEPESARLIPIAHAGSDRDYVDGLNVTTDDSIMARGPTGAAFRTGLPYICKDLLEDPSTQPWRGEIERRGFRATVALPIREEGIVRGTLTVYTLGVDFFRDREIALLTDVVHDLSFGLGNLVRLAQRQRAEVAARQLAAIVESSEDAIVAINEAFVVTEWNRAAQDIFGYRPSEAVGAALAMLLPPDRQDEPIGFWQQIDAGGHVCNYETVRQAKDGRSLDVSITVSALRAGSEPHDRQGRMIGLSMIMRDISEAKRLAKRAQREESFSRAMIESMPGILYFYNEEGRFLRWNRNFEKFSGYSAGEIAQMHPLEFISGPHKALVQERIREVLRTGESGVEANFIAKDGTAMPYFFTGKRVMFDGVPCLVGMGIDISERQRAEAALADYAKRLQSASRQLLTVQENERRALSSELHDTVGQELTALNLNLTMLATRMPAELRERLKPVLDDSERLLTDTSQHLRDIMVELRPPGIDELGLVAALTEHVRRVARRSGLTFSVNGREPVPRLTPASAIAIFRIVQEALNNTVKHAQATHITVNVENRHDKVHVCVIDDGQGFVERPAHNTSAYGMGMTTMSERADSIGARLSISSVPGEGTTITIDIPLAAEIDSESTHQQQGDA